MSHPVDPGQPPLTPPPPAHRPPAPEQEAATQQPPIHPHQHPAPPPQYQPSHQRPQAQAPGQLSFRQQNSQHRRPAAPQRVSLTRPAMAPGYSSRGDQLGLQKDGKWDREALDARREGRRTPSWGRDYARILVISCMVAAFTVAVIWAFGAGLLLDRQYDTVQGTSLGTMAGIIGAVFGFGYLYFLFDNDRDDHGMRPSGLVPLFLVGSASYAFIVAVVSLVWPLVADFSSHTGQVNDSWGSSALSVAVLLCIVWLSAASGFTIMFFLTTSQFRPGVITMSLVLFAAGVGYEVYFALVPLHKPIGDFIPHFLILLLVTLVQVTLSAALLAYGQHTRRVHESRIAAVGNHSQPLGP